ncbi:hypothetical protein ACIBCL_19185 [Micromonospora zamorensis]|uniref:hypothetical protein n=1 Tax=Micromonospora zamorensis TaxID=709883 RepID=UPI0037909084
MKPARALLVALLGFTVVGVAVTLVLASIDLMKADQLASVAGAVAALIALALSVLKSRSLPDAVVNDDAIYGRLAAAAEEFFSVQVRIATGGHGRELPLRWVADPDLAGDAESLAGLVASVRPKPLIIIGDAGAGKTTLLTLLGRALLADRKDRQPIPILCAAASWQPDLELPEAIVVRTLVATGFLAGPGVSDEAALAGQLVRRGLVLPLIDGLDELPETERLRAAAALDQLSTGYVATCRTTEFANLPSTALTRAVVIQLMPVTGGAIGDFLAGQDPVTAERWRPVIDQIAAVPAGSLARALATPWLAVLARDAFASRTADPRVLLDSQDPEGLLVERMLERLPGRARTWLAELAELSARSPSEIVWWRLTTVAGGPAAAAGWIRWVGLLLLIAATAGIAGSGAPALALAAAIVLTLRAGLIERRPGPRRVAWLGWSGFGRAAIEALAGFVIIPAVLVFSAIPESLLLFISTHRIETNLAGGVGAVTMVVAMVTGRRRSPAAPRSLQQDQLAAILRALSAAGLGGVMLWAAPASPAPATVIALSMLLLLLVVVDDSAWGQYTVARLWLAGRGRLPFRLGRFLADAERAGVLRRAGHEYRFRHAGMSEVLIRRASARRGPAAAVVDEMLVQVLALPAVIEYLAPAPAERREALEQQVRREIAADPVAVLESGSAQYERFRQARRQLVAAAVPTWARWSSAYGMLAGVAAVTAVFGFGNALWSLRISPLTGPVAVTVGAVLLGGVVAHVAGRRDRRGLVATCLTLMVLAFAALLILAGAAFRRAPGAESLVVVAAVAASLMGLLWVGTRQHADAWHRLRSDDPSRWPEPGRSTRRYDEATRQAREDWLAAMARNWIVPKIWTTLRQNRDGYSLRLPVLNPGRLGDVTSTEQLVENAASGRVAWVLRELEGASIGISGPRGTGKSTVLQRYCTEQFRADEGDVLVLVQAPTTYDRREFLVHLFAETCVQLGAPPAARLEAHRWWSRVRALLPAVVVLAGVVLISGVVFGAEVLAAFVAIWQAPRTSAYVLGGLLILTPLLWRLWRDLVRHRSKVAPSPSAALAARHLQTLRYQSVFSRKTGGKFAIPGGLDLSAEGQVQRTEQLRTYPELVAQFRELLYEAALERRRRGQRIIIGVDELDKIGSADDAERFINDLKSVFGVRGCYFLVAVSEDALAAFDRRALGVRTAFDSAFDLIIAVGSLSVTEAGKLLQVRGLSVPEPYLWLCHILSAGRPRELLRTVMALATISSERKIWAIDKLAIELVAADFASILRSQVRAAEIAATQQHQAVRWIVQVHEATMTAELLEKACTDMPSVERTDPISAILVQTQAYLYLAATLLRAFAENPQSTVTTLGPASGGPPVERLVQARSRITAHPDLAWPAIDDFRRLIGLPLVEREP